MGQIPIPSAQVAAEADAFEASLAGVPKQLHDGLWDVYVPNPSYAAVLVSKLKAPAPTPPRRMKAQNARSLSTRALNLMEDLGEVMDDSAYAQLLEPIIRHLEQAQRTMQQGTAQAGQQAAAGVSMKKEAKTKTKTAGDGLPAFMRVPPGYQGEL